MASFRDPPPYSRVLSAGEAAAWVTRRSGLPVRNAVPGGPTVRSPCAAPILSVRQYPGRRADPARYPHRLQSRSTRSLPLPSRVPGLLPKPASNSGYRADWFGQSEFRRHDTVSLCHQLRPAEPVVQAPTAKVYRVDTAGQQGEVATQWGGRHLDLEVSDLGDRP